MSAPATRIRPGSRMPRPLGRLAGSAGVTSRVPPAGPRSPDSEPETRLFRFRAVQVAVTAAMVALPLLRPAGPGNTGMVDLALLLAILASGLWASTRALRLRLPYAVPVAFSVLAGGLALLAAVAGGTGAGTTRGLLALVQDLFLLGWAATVATLGRDLRVLDLLCRAWAYSVAGWAAVLIVSDLLGVDWLAGIDARDGIRVSFTLGDPNLAANYFLIGLLVIRASRRPRATGWRWLATALVVTAVILTLSNGGILAMLVATVLGALFGLARRRGALAALTAGLAVAAAAAALLATVNVHELVIRAETASPLVRDSLGRQAESGGSRDTLLHEGLNLWLHGDTLLGVGPANTEAALRAAQAPYVKEAHDDYLAALLERGLPGGLALVLLGAAVAVRARRIARAGGVPPPMRALVPRPELLAAAVIAVALSAFLYETLHFRHVWALFGLIAALDSPRRRP